MKRNQQEIDNKCSDTEDNKTNAVKRVDYDELLSSAGELGLYQILLFFSTFPFYIFGVFVYFTQIFITEISSNHWCWVPELENLTDIERRLLAVPQDDNSRFGYSHCTVYVANWSEVLETGQSPNSTWDVQTCRNGWEFNKSEIPYPTISSELGWVCEKDSYQAFAQAIFFIGSAVGGVLFGWVADTFGRLWAATFTNILGCVAGVISVFAVNLIQFSFCRFLMGMAYDNCMMMIYLLALEYVAPKYRTIIANLPFAIFYTFGAAVLPWIAIACGDWKILSAVTSIPMILAIATPFVIPESPRWLLSQGKIDAAVSKILIIGKINKKEVPTKLIEQFKQSQILEQKDKTEENFNLWNILKNSLLRKIFICMCLEYMCCMILFDGLVRSIGGFEFDFFVSFTLVSITEFPSLLLISFILDATGRKWTSIVSLTVCSIFTTLSAFVPSGFASLLCAVVARFFVTMAINISMQWAAEMLPTPVRGSGVSVIHICSYIAAIISPYIVYLDKFVKWLPFATLGFIALCGACFSLILPETASKDMPHTFDDAEILMRNQKFFDIPCLNNKKVNVVIDRNNN